MGKSRATLLILIALALGLFLTVSDLNLNPVTMASAPALPTASRLASNPAAPTSAPAPQPPAANTAATDSAAQAHSPNSPPGPQSLQTKIQTTPGQKFASPDQIQLSDPLSARNLNLPLPNTIQDIVDSPVEYKDPTLPGRAGTTDGSVYTTYKGFYEVQPGKFRMISLFSGSGGVRHVTIEMYNKELKEYLSKYQDFTVSNYNGDPYSTVFHFRSGRIMYVKFYDTHAVPGYEDPDFRSMRGWLIIDGEAHKIAMIDGLKRELEDLKEKNKFVWPALGSVRPLMPADLR